MIGSERNGEEEANQQQAGRASLSPVGVPFVVRQRPVVAPQRPSSDFVGTGAPAAYGL
jgi:hypothetical protein